MVGNLSEGSDTPLGRVFPGDSEMARRMRAHDWSATHLGPPASWPANLRVALGICLSSRFPMHVVWGPELIFFYNDACIPLLGQGKHPDVLSRPGREAWAEIWPQLSPMVGKVLTARTASWSDDILLVRGHELPREAESVTFSFSPVFGEQGAVEGLFCTCTAIAATLLGDRPRITLRELGVEAAEPRGDDARGSEAERKRAETSSEAHATGVQEPNRELQAEGAEQAHENTRQLQKISNLLIADGSVSGFHEHILDAAMAIMRAPFGSIQNFDEERQELHLLAQRNFHPESAAYWQRVSIDAGTSCALALRYGERVILPDVRADETCSNSESLRYYLLSGMIAVQSTPLVTRDGRVIGMISTHWRERHQPNERDLALLDVLARQTADVLERRRAQEALCSSEAWLAGQKEAFQAAVKGAPLRESLDVLIRTAIQQIGEDVRCAFYIADPTGRELFHITGMTEAYAKHVDGFKIGSDSLACGLAVYTGQPFITPDVTKEPLWASWLWMAEMHGYRGCWSFPIETSSKKVVGTFAMYFGSPREATPRDYELAALVTQTAAIIISRHQEAEERAHAEAALRESEERLQVALAAGAMGTWLYRIAQDEQILDESMHHLAGLPQGAASMPLETFLRVVHEDDVDRVRADFDRCLREGDELDTEFRVRWPDGSEHWLKDRGRVFPDPEGRPLFMTGAAVDITDRRRMEEELHEADRGKNEFLAMLGHELRNPLAPLRGVMDTLQRQKLEGPTLERAYAMMDRQVTHLHRLVDDLLDVSRITRGLVELRKEPVSLAEMADRAIEMVTPAVEGRGHDLHLSLPRRPAWVEGDPTRLTQVIFNLLNNAAKYTDPGGKIWLAVEREGAQATVRVRDNGTGMKPALVLKVFDLFTQGERTLDRSQGGLGLGLTLVKRLVEMHGGTVEARSEGPDKGSEFIVCLPALPAGADTTSPPRPPSPPPSVKQVSRTLVVDDVPDIAEGFSWMLEGLTLEIEVVHSGAEAVELARDFLPDLVLCDLGMPGMDGYETCRRLRRLPGLEKAVIAAISGYEEQRQQSQEAGFDRHLVKPIGRAVLEELVKSAAVKR